MERRLKLIVTVSVLVGILAAPAAVATVDMLSGGEPVSGDIPIGAEDGPLVIVTGASELELTDFTPNENTVEVTSDVGNATLSSNGPTNVTLDQIEGAWTETSGLNVTANALTINPADKPAVTVSGDAHSLEFREIEVDGQTTDFVYNGSSGTTTLTVRDLDTTEQVAAVDTNTNEVLDVATPNSSGAATFTMPNSEHSVQLVTSDGPPVLSNPTPVNDQSTVPDTVTVDVDDADFPADTVNVTAELDGSTIGTTEVDSAGTVSFSVNPDAGINTVEWTATDEYGQTDMVSQEFGVPNTLQIRNESAPDELVNDSVDVTLTFFGQDGSIEERTTSNGSVNMTGLPADEEFVVDAQADDYYSRTVVVESLAQQQNIYLLPQNQSAVEVEFVLDDQTGQFPVDNTVLKIQKALTTNNTTRYRTILGDEFSANGAVSTFLDEGERYRLIIETDERQRVLGSYRATRATTVELEVGQLSFALTEENTIGLNATRTTQNGTTYIQFGYRDPDMETTDLSVTVHERGNASNEIFSDFDSGPLGNYTATVPLNASQTNTSYVVQYEYDRGGRTHSGSLVPGFRQRPPGLPMDPFWIHVGAVGILIGVGGLFSAQNVGAGAIVVPSIAGILWYFDFLPPETGVLGIAIALGIGVIYKTIISSQEVPA